MTDLLIYILLAIIGYFISAKLIKHPEKLTFISPIQTFAIGCLVVSMGARMGANDEVIRNLNKIGLYALLFTLIVITGSVACVSVTRRWMKLDRYGHSILSAEEAEVTEETEETQGGGGSMTLFIVITVIAGMILGYLVIHLDFMEYERFDAIAGQVIKAGLCLLLFLVGLDMGRENTFIEDIRSAGLRVLLIPGAACVGTLLASALCSLFLPMSLKESLAVGAGFGWYSLAPVMIMEKGMVTVSAVSFMHNVFRELIALLLMPVVAKKIGYVEVAGMPGAGAGDVCLPFIVRATRSGMVLYAFVTGITLSILVPILVPIFIA